MKKHVIYLNLLKTQAMKTMKFWLVALAMLAAAGVWGQGWIKTYDGGGDYINFSIAAPFPDGNIVVATKFISNSEPIWLFKTDPWGNIITEKFIADNEGSLILYDMTTLPEGGVVLVGQVLSATNGNHFYISRLDDNLEVVWLKKSPYTYDDISTIIPAPNHGYTLGGRYLDLGGIGPIPALIRLDSLGNELWQDVYDEQDVQDAEISDVITTEENQFVWVGIERWNSTPQISRIFLTKTDSIGQRLWVQHLPTDDSLKMRALCLALSSDEGYLIGGDENFSESAFCIKTDSNGELVWKKNWESEDGLWTIIDIKPISTGGYVLLCNVYSLLGWEIHLIRIDEDGNTLWEKLMTNQVNAWGDNLITFQFDALGICGNFGEFQDSVILIKTDANGNLYTSALTGTLHHDPESDCLPDPTEPGLSGWLVQATGTQSFATLTDSLGHFTLPVDTGSYTVTIAPPSPYWDVCNSPATIAITAFYDTLSLDFPAQAIVDCPYLTVDISAPFLRRCFDNNYYVHYCNDGTATANDATVEVTLDPYFTYVSSTLPLASQNGNTLSFDLGDVAVGDCGSFQITAHLDCDSTILGQTHCTSAHITPDSLCLQPDPLWDGSSIEVDVSCSGDTVVFTITNVGTGGMPAPLGYIIIEDQIVLMTDEFQLGPGQSTSITLPANGSTFRLEAQQALEHPSGFASTGATIEGCGGWMSLGWFTQWAFDDDPDPFTDVDCQANIGSFDPNDKQGFPAGFTEEHLIEPGQDIEYLIRFQNTGTDTAFKVTVVDVLPPELYLATVRPGASSHPYIYGVTPEGWLTFTFNDIMLPDSNTNEAASHGFIRFRASQRPGLGWGNVIANTALIYFDFNAPIQTNTYQHRIGQVFPWTVVGSTPPVFHPKTQVRIVPNPLTDSAVLQVYGIEPGPLRLVLTDVSGKVLRQQTVNGTGFEFQRGELPSGLFFFTIDRNGERVGNGKLMVK